MRWQSLLVTVLVLGSPTLGPAIAAPAVPGSAPPKPAARSHPEPTRPAAGAGGPHDSRRYLVAARMGWAIS